MSGPVLLGRTDALRAIEDAVAGSSGDGGALLVRGDAGIGKTALLQATASGARERGARVLTTAGVESEAALAFAGLHQLLRPVLGGVDRLRTPQRAALSAAVGLADSAV